MFSALKEYLYTQYQQLRNATRLGKQRTDPFGAIRMHVCNGDLENGVYTHFIHEDTRGQMTLDTMTVTREKAFYSHLWEALLHFQFALFRFAAAGLHLADGYCMPGSTSEELERRIYPISEKKKMHPLWQQGLQENLALKIFPLFCKTLKY